jgi:hypothetical protein
MAHTSATDKAWSETTSCLPQRLALTCFQLITIHCFFFWLFFFFFLNETLHLCHITQAYQDSKLQNKKKVPWASKLKCFGLLHGKTAGAESIHARFKGRTIQQTYHGPLIQYQTKFSNWYLMWRSIYPPWLHKMWQRPSSQLDPSEFSNDHIAFHA